MSVSVILAVTLMFVRCLKKMIKKNGFTLVELLVVLAILSLLATVGFGQYRTSQKKARDAQRKADLDNIGRAVEMYYNDNGVYPLGDDGLISVDGAQIGWDEQLIKEYSDQSVVYMKSLPIDPADNQHYCYQSTGSYYRVFAVLENENDSDIAGPFSCTYQGEAENYNYGTASPNVGLTD
jgi:general secretion pathway protein G